MSAKWGQLQLHLYIHRQCLLCVFFNEFEQVVTMRGFGRLPVILAKCFDQRCIDGSPNACKAGDIDSHRKPLLIFFRGTALQAFPAQTLVKFIRLPFTTPLHHASQQAVLPIRCLRLTELSLKEFTFVVE